MTQAKVKNASNEHAPAVRPAEPVAPPSGGGRPSWVWAMLVAVPVAGALLRLAVFGISSAGTAEGHSIEVAVAEAAATLGCFIAATSFEWRDHLARAWAIQGCMY